MNNWIKILAVVALILIGITAFFWGQRSSQPPVSIELNKQMYNRGEEIRITVRNNSFGQICFSSCFPYYLQRKDKNWHSYDYPSCPEKNMNIPCLSSGQTRKFKFELGQSLQDGLHRIAVPINKKATAGEGFEEDQKVHSPPFEVK